jgi:hypothetical protein
VEWNETSASQIVTILLGIVVLVVGYLVAGEAATSGLMSMRK